MNGGYKDILASDPVIAQAIAHEYRRQSDGMELVASENYQSAAVLLAQSSHFANKYSEGYPGKRYYGGQEYTDIIEQTAIDRAKALFGSDHANVQALSGAAANTAIYAGLLNPGDTILGMDLTHGGHLTHGAPVTFFSRIFNFARYKTLPDGRIDYEQVADLARQHKPAMILAGFSSYPREIDYARFASIAKEVGAIAFADMSHIGGLIAGGVCANPLRAGFDVMMTTSHKSLRGPRGAIILSQGTVSNPLKKPDDTHENIPTRIDRSVFPGMQGGPHMNTIAALAIALHEAQQPSFATYAQNVVHNAKIMAECFLSLGYTLVTGGTDNHMIVIDLRPQTMSGSDAQKRLDRIGISLSKSSVPDDTAPPFNPSGIRIGMQAMTTRGITEPDVRQIVSFMHQGLTCEEKDLDGLHQEVTAFCHQFPVPTF